MVKLILLKEPLEILSEDTTSISNKGTYYLSHRIFNGQHMTLSITKRTTLYVHPTLAHVLFIGTEEVLLRLQEDMRDVNWKKNDRGILMTMIMMMVMVIMMIPRRLF